MTTIVPILNHGDRSRSAPGALHRRLRAETRPWHERIEGVVPVLRAGLDRRGYERYLEALTGYYRPLEARLGAVAGWGSLGLDFALRRKAELIDRDRCWLGAGGRAPATGPECGALPNVSSLAAATGCLYVLEGSTLGSRVLGRHVHATLGLGAADGAAFLHGYGDATGAMWDGFVAALDALSATGVDEGLVITGATETFETLESWLRSRKPE